MSETSLRKLADDFSRYTEEYSENTLNELLDGKVKQEISESKKKVDLEKNKCVIHLKQYEEEIMEHQRNIDELKPQSDKEWEEYNKSGKKEQKARNEANKNRNTALKKEAKEDEEDLSEADKAKEAARLKASESIQYSKDATNHLENYERLQQEIDKEIESLNDKKNRKEQLELASEWLDFFHKESDYIFHLNKHNYFCRRLHDFQELIARLQDLKKKYSERDNEKIAQTDEMFRKESKCITDIFRQLYCDCYLEISHLIEDAQNEQSIKNFKIIRGYNDLIKQYKDLCNTEEELELSMLLSLENGNKIITMALDTDSPCPAIDLVLEDDCTLDFTSPADDVDEIQSLFKNILSSRKELVKIEVKYFDEVKKSVSSYTKACFDSVKSIAKEIETSKSNTIALTKSYNKHHTTFNISYKSFENSLNSKTTPIKEMKSLIEKENNIIKEQYLQSVVVELGKIRSDPLDCGLEQYKTLRQIDVYNVANDVLSSTKTTNEFYLILLPLRETKQRLIEENYKYQWFVALYKLIELSIISGGPMNKTEYINQLESDVNTAIEKLEIIKDDLNSTYITVKNKMDELDSILILVLNKAEEFNTYRDDDIYRNLTSETHYCARQLGNTKDSLRNQFMLLERSQKCCSKLLEMWNNMKNKVDNLSNGNSEKRNLLEEQQVSENNYINENEEYDENVIENNEGNEKIPSPPANSPENLSNNYNYEDDEETREPEQMDEQQNYIPMKEDEVQDSEIVENNNVEFRKQSVQEIPAPAVSTDDFRFSIQQNEAEEVNETEAVIKPEAPSDDINQEQIETISPPEEPPLEQQEQPTEELQEQSQQQEQPQEEQPIEQSQEQSQEQPQQEEQPTEQPQEERPFEQSQEQPIEAKPAAKPTAKPGVKAAVKSASPKKGTTAAKPAAKPGVKVAGKPVVKTIGKPGVKVAGKPVVKIIGKPGVKAPTKPASPKKGTTADKPAAKPHPIDPDSGLVPKKEDVQPTESSNQDIEELPLGDDVNDGIADDDQIEVYLPDTPAENEDEYEHLNNIPINTNPRDIPAEDIPSRRAIQVQQQQQQQIQDEQYQEDNNNSNDNDRNERRKQIKELSPKDNEIESNDSTNSHEISFNLWKDLLLCHVENLKNFYPTSFDMYYLDVVNVIDKIAKNLNIIFYTFRDQHKIYNNVYTENKKKALITANITVMDSLSQRNVSESELFDKNYPRAEFKYLMYESKLQYESFGNIAYEEFESIEKELNEFQNKFKAYFLDNPKSVKCLQLVHLQLCELADDNNKVCVCEQSIIRESQLIQHYFEDLNNSYEICKPYLKKVVSQKFKKECENLLIVAKKYKTLFDKYNNTLMGRGASGFACCFGGSSSKAKNYPSCERNWTYKSNHHDELSRS